MKAFGVLTLLLSLFLPFTQAQNGTDILLQATEALPPCALKCMMALLIGSECGLTNFQCVAGDEEIKSEISACVLANCTIRESLTTKNFTETLFGHPVRDHTKLVSHTAMIAGGFATLAVVLRIFARIPWFGGTWGHDDWAIVVAMLPVLPLTGLSIPLANDGLGRDMWAVPFDNITHILHIYYFDELFYLLSIAITKISILLFYLRIFPNREFRRWVHATLALCILYIIGFIPATILQCLPIRIAWQRWDGEHHGQCINLNAEAWASAALNIVFDLVVICLPMQELSKLAMNRRRKAGVMLMFLGGGLVTIISILRLKWMIQFANTSNVTWDYTPVGYWSTLEVHVGIIVACLPALRSLQNRLFRGDRPGSKHPSAYSYSSPSAYKKGGSPFPSITGKFKNPYGSGGGGLSSQGGNTVMRNRDRANSDKELIDAYELQLEPDAERGNINGGGADAIRGFNETQVARGSIREHEGTFLDDGSLTALPSASSYTPNEQQHGISVRKEYSVNVEYKPKDYCGSPPPQWRGTSE